MPRPLLPPRGIFVPTLLVYHRDIPPAALHTWMQLRGLAWGKPETPALNMQEVSELTGKSPATIYGHMALLRNRGALRWRSSGTRTFIVTFDVPGDEGFQESGESIPDSKNLEKPSLLTPPLLTQNLNLEEEEREGAFQKSGKTFQKSGKKFQNSGMQFQNTGKSGDNPPSLSGRGDGGEGGDTDLNPLNPLSKSVVSDPISLYQSATNLRPNQPQRKKILAAVADLTLWQSTLEHWQSHRWNPKNVPGLLDLYKRGGGSACIYCQKANEAANPPKNPSLDAIDQVRQNLKRHGRA